MTGPPRRPWLTRRRLALWAAALLIVAAGLAAFAGRAWWADWQCQAAEAAVARRDLADARARLAAGLARWPDHPRWRLLAARVARLDGDLAAAERHLEHAQRFDTDADALILERALLRAQQGQLGPVEGFLVSRARHGHADSEFILEALAQGYMKAHRLPEAQDCLDRLLALRPEYAPAHVWRGEVLEWWNDLDEAAAAYRRAVAAAPDDVKARRRLALALVRGDHGREAAELLEGLRGHGEDVELLFGLARARRGLGEADAANRLLDRVLAQRPDHAPALAERGLLRLQAGRPADALAPLEKALKLAPYERETNYTYYLCLRRLGREADAEAALATVRRLNADLQRVAALRRQITASPRDAALRCEVGLIFLRNGQTREGLRWLRSAVEIDPSHAAARQALAEHAEQKDDRR